MAHLFQNTTEIVISSLLVAERPFSKARLGAVTSHGLLRAEAATLADDCIVVPVFT